MARDPWTDPDPQPGDFDEFLASIDPRDPRYVQVIEAGNGAKVTRLPAGMDEEDVKRLAALAVKRGKTIGEVLIELVREA
jgi:hypothetical protein